VKNRNVKWIQGWAGCQERAGLNGLSRPRGCSTVSVANVPGDAHCPQRGTRTWSNHLALARAPTHHALHNPMPTGGEIQRDAAEAKPTAFYSSGAVNCGRMSSPSAADRRTGGQNGCYHPLDECSRVTGFHDFDDADSFGRCRC